MKKPLLGALVFVATIRKYKIIPFVNALWDFVGGDLLGFILMVLV